LFDGIDADIGEHLPPVDRRIRNISHAFGAMTVLA
jgi:hypothetical protein